MSKTIKYVECAHCGEIVGTYYVTCPYCGYKLAARKPTTGMNPLYGMTDVSSTGDSGACDGRCWNSSLAPSSLAELEKALDSMDHDGITRGD